MLVCEPQRRPCALSLNEHRLMKPGPAFLILMAVCTLAATRVAAQDRAGDQEQTALQQLIRGLGDDTFEARQQAMKQIWGSPHLTLESLQRFAETADPETAARIQRLIDQIQMGITPRTRPEIARRIYAFHSAEQDEMFSILYELVQLGQHELVMNLITSLDDEYVREYLASSVFDEDHSPIYALLEPHADALDADTLQRLDAVMDHPFMWQWHPSDCLVYWSLRQQVPQKIRHLESDFLAGTPAAELRIRLIELLRFSRRYDEALDHIDQLQGSAARQNAMRQRVLRESGRWSDLANEYDQNRVADTGHLSRAGEAALLHHWSGNQERQANWHSKITADESPESYNALATVQLAELDLAGLMVSSKKMTRGVAFQMLCRVEQYEAAFRISGAPADVGQRRIWFRRQLRVLGRKLNLSRTSDDEQAQREALDLLLLLPTFARTVGELGDVEQSRWYFEQLADRLRDEVSYQSLFWRSQAFEQVARLNIGEDIWHFFEMFALHDEYERAVETLFPDTPDQANMWSEILRQSLPDPVERIRFIASLLRSPYGNPEQQFDIELLATMARKYIDRRPPVQRANYLLLLGQTCRLHQRQSLARDLTLEAGYLGESEAFVALADEAAEAQQWQRAERWARRLHEISPLTRNIYRIACYRKQSGHDEAFASEFRRAGLLDLHSWNMLDSAQMLEQNGLPGAAVELIQRFLSGITADQADVYWEHQRLAMLLKDNDPRRATSHWRQAQLSWMRHVDLSVNNIFRTQFFATQAAMAEAQAALNDGQTAVAGEILLRSLNVSSATTSLVERFVPQLDAAGESLWAERIFDSVVQRFQAVLAVWPNSALHHNNLAWACARCARRPDLQLQHARRAVELEPDNTSYLDTLGEVLFLAGQNDEAAELAAKCVALNPFSKHYRQQLERFAAER